MIHVMRKTSANIRTATKEASHERIVDAAARAIRRSGYNGTGVADIMKEAGLTHGAFYAHFESREAMLAEAADRAGADANALAANITATVPPEQALQALVQVYLSKEHLAAIETGCPISALGSEMPRQSPEVRSAATRRIKEMIDLIALPNAGPGPTQRARTRAGNRGDDGGHVDAGTCGERRRVVRCTVCGHAKPTDFPKSLIAMHGAFFGS